MQFVDRVVTLIVLEVNAISSAAKAALFHGSLLLWVTQTANCLCNRTIVDEVAEVIMIYRQI